MTSPSKVPSSGYTLSYRCISWGPVRVPALTLFLFLVTAPVVAAQNNHDTCLEILKERAPSSVVATVVPKQACNALAGFIFGELTDPNEIASRALAPRDLQNRGSQQAAAAGTPAQGHALPSVQPAGVAAGTIAAIGTTAGQAGLAALSVNPTLFFLADRASEQLAKWSRFADVTVLIPITGTDGGDSGVDAQGQFRYMGARVRLNITGLPTGSQLWDGATKALASWVANAAPQVAELNSVLSRLMASDVRRCTEALLGRDTVENVRADCGGTFSGFVLDEGAAIGLRRELAEIRREADARYVGVDLRVDVGDPTLGDVENARGRYLFAGVSAGRRFASFGAADLGVRGRLGLRHATLESGGVSEVAADGGVGLELSRVLDDQKALTISGGVEFRAGNAADENSDRLRTDFAALRASVLSPVGSGNSVSINLSRPIRGNVPSAVSVNFNWGLLLSERASALTSVVRN